MSEERRSDIGFASSPERVENEASGRQEALRSNSGNTAGADATAGPATAASDKLGRASRVGEKEGSGLFRSHPIKTLLGALVALALAVSSVPAWRYFHSYVSTEDAEVDGNIVPVSARIAGSVRRIYVHDTQLVKKGERLVELDPRDYQVAVERASAGLDEARGQVAAAQADYAAALASLSRAKANNVKAQGDAKRYSVLAQSRIVSREAYDDKMRIARVAAATVESNRAAADAAAKTVAVRRAAVEAAKAALAQASLNLSYTRIDAPVGGVVGNKTVQVGQRIEPGQGLLTVTDLRHLWVTANFKEIYFGKIRPGQRATIHVDALGRNLEGYVEGLGGATGALYSLLPPENATGNWVKVVERLPVRIRFDQGDDPSSHLRPGQSVEVKVWLR